MNERELFMAALQIEDAAERAAYLDRACAGEATLRRRVETLLAALGRLWGPHPGQRVHLVLGADDGDAPRL